MKAGGGKNSLQRYLPSTPDVGSDMEKLPRAITVMALGGAPMLVLAGLARLRLVDAAGVPVWLVLGVLALACVAYFLAMSGATGQRGLAALLAIGLPSVLYFFSDYGGPGAVVAAFALVTMWIVSIIAAVSFANLGDSQ